MAFFKWNWGAKKVDQAKAGLKKFGSSKPDIYNTVRDLRVELKAEANENHSKDIINALQQLDARLDEIQQTFNKNTNQPMNVFEYAFCCREFANDCRSAILSYEPTLIAAPGIWNKCKAYINLLVEYFNYQPFLEVEKSTLGLKEDFRQQFNNTKSDLMPKKSPSDSEDDQCSCFPMKF
ncbi:MULTISPECIES: hypothetical protein [Legionella]|uniref:hypothetical protein n=1 Tax=Legionella TaxID=445 RepID=UPI00096480B6|nr:MULTISPECIES: hypothetical protein [Legionella]MBN9227038.1 hypothetical protein [Legionella steelei]OJW14088.1 MAG: hypothetical protein BGO44_09060 [Legionella sp. 39-23]